MLGRTVEHLVDRVEQLWRELPSHEQVRSCTHGCSWQSTTDAQIKLFSQIVATRPEAAHA